MHGFQGTECDVVVASFGISDGSGRSRRFLEDPHLFNVLVTRAKQQMIVLVSVEDPPSGILADYLRWAADPAPRPPDHGAADAWTKQLATVLRDSGTEVRTGYEIGRWTMDLVIGPPHGAVAVTTRVHPDGIGAHIERNLSLDRMGWRQAEAFPAGPHGDAVATALALAHLLPSPPT
ncbi:AAA domain-containing protein [Aquihabitans daechungensis]|uniref:AAA domain-containing protein n=1 Tax=Aquihabitans daechungensis TaxID=1052257 RepID=UPI003B9F279C